MAEIHLVIVISPLLVWGAPLLGPATLAIVLSTSILLEAFPMKPEPNKLSVPLVKVL